MRIIVIIGILLFASCKNEKEKTEILNQESNDFEMYDKLVRSGMLHYKDNEYELALFNFHDAFKIIPNELTNHYFYAAASALHLGQDDKAEQLLINAIEKTNASESYFLRFEEFNNFRNKELFKKIENEYDMHKKVFFDNLENPEIYYEIEDLITKDQEVRTGDYSTEEMQKVDSLNITRLIEINKEYGWQEKQWLLLWHHRRIHRDDNYIWNYFRPYINEKIEKGELRKDFWARFDDEKSMFSEKGTQIYGTYWYNYEQFPIENIDIVDSLRNNVGLPPLAYLKKVYGIVPPKEYDKELPVTLYIKK
ncbi:hypothetical protein [Tenacibaculum sp. SG-28]|uniref:hypothetical protein n=1 Tax=Tenacibaculum sp. SG-28 TaxID=754426 RepID=UPI000CF4787C|nr:hypothetical protein [Tenacibaculum sp. SG-28]PQJ19574.1 hypothetical protein BSU00_12235 [Tenacibaculum sp. SG-28]